jgi:hypothetical protein
MRTSTFTLTTDDGDMEVYEAAPDGDAVGGVIVIQEASRDAHPSRSASSASAWAVG